MHPAIVGAAANLEVVVVPGDTGWQLPGTAANSGSGTFWASAGNVRINDGSYASAPIPYYQFARDVFGTNFDFSAIPDAATITKMECRAEMKKTSSGGNLSGNFRIVVAGAEAGSGSSFIALTTSDVLYSRDSGLWGLTPSVAQVKASNFGFSLNNFEQGSWANETAFCDYMEMKITWA